MTISLAAFVPSPNPRNTLFGKKYIKRSDMLSVQETRLLAIAEQMFFADAASSQGQVLPPPFQHPFQIKIFKTPFCRLHHFYSQRERKHVLVYFELFHSSSSDGYPLHSDGVRPTICNHYPGDVAAAPLCMSHFEFAKAFSMQTEAGLQSILSSLMKRNVKEGRDDDVQSTLHFVPTSELERRASCAAAVLAHFEDRLDSVSRYGDRTIRRLDRPADRQFEQMRRGIKLAKLLAAHRNLDNILKAGPSVDAALSDRTALTLSRLRSVAPFTGIKAPVFISFSQFSSWLSHMAAEDAQRASLPVIRHSYQCVMRSTSVKAFFAHIIWDITDHDLRVNACRYSDIHPNRSGWHSIRRFSEFEEFCRVADQFFGVDRTIEAELSDHLRRLLDDDLEWEARDEAWIDTLLPIVWSHESDRPSIGVKNESEKCDTLKSRLLHLARSLIGTQESASID